MYISIADNIVTIKSFADSETEKIWKGNKSPKLPPEIHKRAFANNEAYEVQIVDYH